MQRLASTVNTLTTPFAHRIAFEALDSSGLIETWREGGALGVKLKIM